MPKLPPPPRSAQNRSGCSSALAVTQLAVGGDELERRARCRSSARTCAPASRRRRRASGRRRRSCETTPTGTASPCRWVSRSRSPSVAPPCTRTVRVSGSTSTPRMAERSMTRPSSQSARPGDVVAAAAHRDEQVVRAGELHRVDHVGDAEAAGDQPGMPVDRRVPDPARRVVVGDRRAGSPSGQGGGEFVDFARINAGAIAALKLSLCHCLLPENNSLLHCGPIRGKREKRCNNISRIARPMTIGLDRARPCFRIGGASRTLKKNRLVAEPSSAPPALWCCPRQFKRQPKDKRTPPAL